VSAGAQPARACGACGTELAPAFLACPSCGKLVHAEALKVLAAEAESATRAQDTGAALAKWREALALLPPGSVQHARVEETVKALSTALDAAGVAPGAAAAPPAAGGKKRGKIYGALAALGALLVKFKVAVLFLLGKGKLLLVGLFKWKTLLSMVIALGAYTTVFGWRFALGLIVSIYVHEMGHVERLRHYGIPATAPMFIPGLGAFVRLKQRLATPREDARVGLAGPLWGTAAALVFLAIGLLGHHPSALAIAHAGAWINLFNLIPVWQLDGGRAFNALSKRQRALSAGLLWLLLVMSSESRENLLVMLPLAVAASYRATRDERPSEGDSGIFLEYTAIVLLLVVLAVMARAPS
jgi:Zn-dependent protease